MAAYPWLRSHAFQGQQLQDYPSVQRWYQAVRARPAVQRGLAVLKERFEKNRQPPTGKAWDNLFGSNQFSANPAVGPDGGAT
jgi:GST-like protein